MLLHPQGQSFALQEQEGIKGDRDGPKSLMSWTLALVMWAAPVSLNASNSLVHDMQGQVD